MRSPDGRVVRRLKIYASKKAGRFDLVEVDHEGRIVKTLLRDATRDACEKVASLVRDA